MKNNEVLKTRISSKGQVVLPAYLREKLQLKEGDELEVIISGEDIILRPLHQETLLDCFGIIKVNTPLKPVKDIRDQVYEEEFLSKI